ncbi:MAG: hypothetical protein IJL92_08460 [Thermoguttaceae bacterium]|nr:hypothetical protein [Thermoguttaceae bacterium]
MSDNAPNDNGLNDPKKDQPRLTSLKLKTGDSPELAPMTLDEFNAAFETARAGESTGEKGATAIETEPSAATGFGDFGDEIERQVRRASSVTPSSGMSSDFDPFKSTPRPDGTNPFKSTPRPDGTDPFKSTPSPDGTDPFKSTPKPVEKPAKPAPLPSSQTPPKTSFKLPTASQPATSPKAGSANASQPDQRQKPLSSPPPAAPAARPNRNDVATASGKAPEPPLRPRFDPKTGRPLEQPPLRPRFDPKTGKPLEQPPTANNLNPFAPQKTASEERKAPENESEQTKKKPPQIGCSAAIAIIFFLAWAFEMKGVVIGVFAIVLINGLLRTIFGDSNSKEKGK